MKTFASTMTLLRNLCIAGETILALACVAAGGDGKYSDGNIGVMLGSFGLCLLCAGVAYIAKEFRDWAYEEIKRKRLIKQREYLKKNKIKENDYE